MNLPMKAFCLNGYNEKIELFIDEIIGYPESTSIEGGYDFNGRLYIHIGCHDVRCESFYSSTGILYRLLVGLMPCYEMIKGIAEYKPFYEKDFYFSVEMTKSGHANVNGAFREFPHSSNRLTFEMETDQTCILEVINDLKAVAKIFGDNIGKKTK